MKFNKIAILTTKSSWLVPYSKELVKELKNQGFYTKLFYKHENISTQYQVVFILSYFRIIPQNFLDKHQHNLVVHESALPKGKGWAPLFWQILEGKNKIPIVLIEAAAQMDAGPIYIKDFIQFKGDELNSEIRHQQALKTIEICKRFLIEYEQLTPKKQKGLSTFYKKRSPKDSILDINKSIKQQFNLLRIVDNTAFPAYFLYKGKRYIIQIKHDKDETD